MISYKKKLTNNLIFQIYFETPLKTLLPHCKGEITYHLMRNKTRTISKIEGKAAAANLSTYQQFDSLVKLNDISETSIHEETRRWQAQTTALSFIVTCQKCPFPFPSHTEYTANKVTSDNTEKYVINKKHCSISLKSLRGSLNSNNSCYDQSINQSFNHSINLETNAMIPIQPKIKRVAAHLPFGCILKKT